MPQLSLTFGFQITRNLKVGDTVYFVKDDGSPEELGTAASITGNNLVVDITVETVRPDIGSFILFSPGRSVEASGLIGYEGTVVMVNESTSKAELFAVSTEVFNSSR